MARKNSFNAATGPARPELTPDDILDAGREAIELGAALITEAQRAVGDDGRAPRQLSKASIRQLQTLMDLLANA